MHISERCAVSYGTYARESVVLQLQRWILRLLVHTVRHRSTPDQDESIGTFGEGSSSDDDEAKEDEPAESTAVKSLTPLKIRAAGLREANQHDEGGSNEKVIHKNAAVWAGLSTTQFSQVLGVTQWEEEAPLADLPRQAAIVNKRLSVKQRVANRNASLAEYTATRAAKNCDSNGDRLWASRVGRKHKLGNSKSTSPTLRRSQRTPRRTVRFSPGVSNSPVTTPAPTAMQKCRRLCSDVAFHL